MSKTTELTIASAAYSAHNFGGTWYSQWETKNDEVYAGREGIDNGGTYFCSEFIFSTEGVNFVSAESITLNLTDSVGYSNCGRTSAILTSLQLTGKQVYEIDKESQLNETDIPGFISHTFCTSHPNPKDRVTEKGEKVVYQFKNIKILPNKTYYIYVKRRVGLVNSNTTEGIGGWSEFYNPYYKESYNKYGSIVLEYLDEPDWPNITEVYITPAEKKLRPGTPLVQKFQILNKETGEPLSHETLKWSYEIFNKSGTKVNKNDISWVIQEVDTFSFTTESQPGYVIKITGAWGWEESSYSLVASVIYISEWEGLNDWLSGYISGMCGTTMPILIRNIIEYKYGDISLPVLRDYDKEKYPYLSINQSSMNSTIYFASACSEPFYYDSVSKDIYITETAKLVCSRFELGTDSGWGSFEESDISGQIGLGEVVWTNKDIKDKKGQVSLKTYDPIPVYS